MMNRFETYFYDYYTYFNTEIDKFCKHLGNLKILFL